MLSSRSLVLALAKAGKSLPARIAIIAITTSNSMRVNASARGGFIRLLEQVFSQLIDLPETARLCQP